MSGQIAALVRAGLALMAAQLKLATRSYIHDSAEHGKSLVTGYAIAAGLYAAAGLFFIAACLVGAAALFRWIEVKYGAFTAFTVIGGILLIIAAICGAVATKKMHPAKQDYPGLMTRLGVALKDNPLKSSILPANALIASALATRSAAKSGDAAAKAVDRAQNHVESARRKAEDVLSDSSLDARDSRGPSGATKASVALALTLLGWALARRYSRTTRTEI